MIGIAFNFLVLLALQLATPFWWWVLLVPMGWSAFRAESDWHGFYTGFVGAGLLWTCASGVLYWWAADIIAGRVAAMFQLGNPLWLIVITGLLGAFCGGAAGWCGYQLREVTRKREPEATS